MSLNIKRSEFQEQCELFSWARNPLVLKKYPDLALLFCTGNGLRLPIGLAKKFKQQGNLRGVPDVILLVPNREHFGLLIEMKAKGGVVSPEQKSFHAEMIKRNYRCVVCYSAGEAIAEVEEYFKLPKHESNGK